MKDWNIDLKVLNESVLQSFFLCLAQIIQVCDMKWSSFSKNGHLEHCTAVEPGIHSYEIKEPTSGLLF